MKKIKFKINEKFKIEFLEIYFKKKDDSDMYYIFIKKYFENNFEGYEKTKAMVH